MGNDKKGNRQEMNLQVLQKKGELAFENMDKAEMLAKNFVKVHSSDNIM